LIAATLQAIFGGDSTTVDMPPPSGNVAPNQEPASISGPAQGMMPSIPGGPGFTSSGYSQSSTFDSMQAGSAQSQERPMTSATPAVAVEPTTNISTQPGKKIRIIADEPNNALFILATPQDFRDIDAALDRLDVEPLQVLIEATIAEVSLNDKLKYGVEWFFEQGDHSLSWTTMASGAAARYFPASTMSSPGRMLAW